MSNSTPDDFLLQTEIRESNMID